MDNGKYRASFTTGGLFLGESVKLTSLYLELGDWTSVQSKVLAENLLQTRTLSACKRVFREVVSRLQALSRKELLFLVEGSGEEQACLLWIAVCRRYKLIAEFAVEVLRERYINLKVDLSYEDFDSFFNRKAEWHVELDEITVATRHKLRQVLFKMLREAGFLAPNSVIASVTLSPKMLEMIQQGGDALFFPIFESDLKGVN